jgi:hypothetical protein
MDGQALPSITAIAEKIDRHIPAAGLLQGTGNVGGQDVDPHVPVKLEHWRSCRRLDSYSLHGHHNQ